VQLVHETLAQRVRFASRGAADTVTTEVERLGARHVILVAADGGAELDERLTADLAVAVRRTDVPASNPTRVDEDSLAALLRAAWNGSEPR